MHSFWLVLTYDLIGGQMHRWCHHENFFSVYFNSLLYKTNRFQVAMHLFSNRSQRMSKCGKTISETLGCTSCATFLFLPHFDSSVVYYRTDARKLGIYLLSIFSILFSIHFLRCCKENLSNNPELSLLGDPFLFFCHLNVWFRGATVTTHWMPVSLWGQRADKCEVYFAQNSPSFFFDNSFIDQL